MNELRQSSGRRLRKQPEQRWIHCTASPAKRRAWLNAASNRERSVVDHPPATPPTPATAPIATAATVPNSPPPPPPAPAAAPPAPAVAPPAARAEIRIARLGRSVLARSNLLLELVGLGPRRRIGRISGFGRQRRGLRRRSGNRAGRSDKAKRKFKKFASFHQTNPPSFQLADAPIARDRSVFSSAWPPPFAHRGGRDRSSYQWRR